ncbi:hypothetical protein F5880DRAFT_1615398 [Lentinula raphanica]|nr:hypothetical protein F5880DRAFT_1615398 [Lentinula raphanica]
MSNAQQSRPQVGSNPKKSEVVDIESHDTEQSQGGTDERGRSGLAPTVRVIVVRSSLSSETDTPYGLPLILTLEQKGFIVITSVSSPESIEPLEKHCHGWVRALVSDPNLLPGDLSVQQLLRSLASTANTHISSLPSHSSLSLLLLPFMHLSSTSPSPHPILPISPKLKPSLSKPYKPSFLSSES